MTDHDIVPVEYLYGLWTSEDADGYVRTRVIPFRVTEKTARRIFYLRDWIHGDPTKVGSVSRQQIEETGEACNRGRDGCEPDYRLHREPPDLNSGRLDASALKDELERLRAEMSAAHPDRGGTDAGFIEAHRRYASARKQSGRAIAEEVPA